MTLSAQEMTKDGAISVKVTLYNDSDVCGIETVQLYIRDLVASTLRPVQQLIAFEKVELAAGERKTVDFTVTEKMLRIWNDGHKYLSEPGDFEISTGFADNLVFTQKFELK